MNQLLENFYEKKILLVSSANAEPALTRFFFYLRFFSRFNNKKIILNNIYYKKKRDEIFNSLKVNKTIFFKIIKSFNFKIF